MADTIQFNLIGLEALQAKLDTVTHDVKYKGGRFALRKAANLVADKAKAGAQRIDDPETGRSIADNVAVRWSGRRFKQTGDLMFRVGVKQGAKLADGGDTSQNAATPHWRLLEFGTEKMRAQPFMRSALADHISDATNEFLTQYEKALDRAIRRAARQGGG